MSDCIAFVCQYTLTHIQVLNRQARVPSLNPFRASGHLERRTRALGVRCSSRRSPPQTRMRDGKPAFPSVLHLSHPPNALKVTSIGSPGGSSATSPTRYTSAERLLQMTWKSLFFARNSLHSMPKSSPTYSFAAPLLRYKQVTTFANSRPT